MTPVHQLTFCEVKNCVFESSESGAKYAQMFTNENDPKQF